MPEPSAEIKLENPGVKKVWGPKGPTVFTEGTGFRDEPFESIGGYVFGDTLRDAYLFSYYEDGPVFFNWGQRTYRVDKDFKLEVTSKELGQSPADIPDYMKEAISDLKSRIGEVKEILDEERELRERKPKVWGPLGQTAFLSGTGTLEDPLIVKPVLSLIEAIKSASDFTLYQEEPVIVKINNIRFQVGKSLDLKVIDKESSYYQEYLDGGVEDIKAEREAQRTSTKQVKKRNPFIRLFKKN